MGPRILWLTNLAAPYRRPLWSALARSSKLTVGLLEPHKRALRDTGANRGPDWQGVGADGYTVREYRTLRVARGEGRYYALTDPRALRTLLRSDAVLLGGWESPAYWQALAVAKLLRRRVVGFYESTLATQRHRGGAIERARRSFFRALDAVVVPGVAARDAVAAMGVPLDRIHVGFNAIDTDAFRRGVPSAPPADGHRFLYVGQLIARKRVDLILRAFAQIRSGADHLTIVGRGAELARLRALAAELGAQDAVTWVDHVDNAQLADVMVASETLVLASSEEVWGLVVNEALTAGCQVVVTRNCGVAPSVAGMRGVYLASETGDDLADVMARAKQDWDGRIEDPEITRHTPESFAEVFRSALDSSSTGR